ncbi:uncharacterized protein DCS_07892 [Drechmeria coniospora]|uniref:Uncharacterized protein n=1 Tax=Drechmeria coniospora TaxID=98403 RepID=A0A151GFP7_DRECN|nr:uncharacterized protein DCS_07892 [Drechmeria coniospora]KYK55927.1 uncharacterized protein DCS_07892 [Drechmeria coniospora]ODA76774.1 hypothetical protein RJ55_08045 [Drechmeria coniospora]
MACKPNMMPGAGSRKKIPEQQPANGIADDVSSHDEFEDVTTIPAAVSSKLSSRGRGGAGNMADARRSPMIKPSDLETPVLKTPLVTTGRGGTGNIVKNDDPHETRLRQDVGAIPRRYSTGTRSGGRGGAGNSFKETDGGSTSIPCQDKVIADDASTRRCTNPTSTEPESLAAKGKAWLFGKKV